MPATATGPSPEQLGFAADLVAEITRYDAKIGASAQACVDACTSKAAMRQLIDSLIKSRDAHRKAARAAERTTNPLPQVPDGRYAIDKADGSGIAFYKVKNGHTKVFLDLVVSDYTERVPFRDYRRILTAIATDAEAASKRYGQEIGECGRCGRALTNERTRKAGIGDDCAAKPW